MPLNDDVFRAILAMDSYNRGYNAGISGLGGQGAVLGTATLGSDASELLGSTTVANASFFAQTYTWNGHTVISYRGTDQASPSWTNWTLGDVLNGWSTGLGNPGTTQARLAVEFYRAVVGQSVDPRTGNVELTGHSLGGGLAGFVGSLYGKNATMFDNMPFETAVTAAANDWILHPTSGVTTSIYGTFGQWAPTMGANLSGWAVSGEALAAARLASSFQPATLDTGSLVWPVGDLGPVDRHSQSLLAILLYGDKQVTPSGSDWLAARPYFVGRLFDTDVSISAGANTVAGELQSKGDYSNILRTALAYSAIDVGTNSIIARPFGDTGILALFDDATDLGKVSGLNTPGTFINAAASDISKIFVQYAGQLAIGKILQSNQASALNGVLTYDQPTGKLTVDLNPAKWVTGTVNTLMDVKGRDTLAGHVFDAAKADNANSSITSSVYTDYMKAAWAAADTNNITKAVFATGASTTITETAAPNAKSGAPGGVILVANDNLPLLTAWAG